MNMKSRANLKLLAALGAVVGTVCLTQVVHFDRLGTAQVLEEPSQPAPAGGSAWSSDIERGIVRARGEHKDILVHFAAPEPSTYAQQSELALQSPRFAANAGRQFVMIRFSGDSDLSPAELTTRATWAERLKVTSLPATFVLDDHGRPYARCTSQGVSADEWMQTLRELAEVRARRDAELASADAATGAERARHLAAALNIIGDSAAYGYLDIMTKIVELDADNAAGLRDRYAPQVSQARIDAAIQKDVFAMIDRGQFKQAAARIDQLITMEHPTVQQKQLLLAFQGQLYKNAGDMPRAVALMDQAIALDAASENTPRLRAAREALVQADQ